MIDSSKTFPWSDNSRVRFLGDRFDSGTYADDPKVGVFTNEPPADIWMPERVFHRLRYLGLAYELHLLPLVHGTEDSICFNSLQAGVFAEELAFLGETVNDPVLAEYLNALVKMAEQAARSGSDIRFEMP